MENRKNFRLQLLQYLLNKCYSYPAELNTLEQKKICWHYKTSTVLNEDLHCISWDHFHHYCAKGLQLLHLKLRPNWCQPLLNLNQILMVATKELTQSSCLTHDDDKKLSSFKGIFVHKYKAAARIEFSRIYLIFKDVIDQIFGITQ